MSLTIARHLARRLHQGKVGAERSQIREGHTGCRAGENWVLRLELAADLRADAAPQVAQGGGPGLPPTVLGSESQRTVSCLLGPMLSCVPIHAHVGNAVLACGLHSECSVHSQLSDYGNRVSE